MVLLLAACGPKGPGGSGLLEVPGSEDPGDSVVDSAVDSGDSGDSGLGSFDCSTVPEALGEPVELDDARGYNDMAFDADGLMVGNDTAKFWKTDHTDDASVWVPGIGMVYGMDWLPSGDLVAAREEGGLLVVTPEGGTSVLASDMRPYSVAVGPDGRIYTGDGTGEHRIDPDSGEIRKLVPRSYKPRGIDFSVDYSVLYIGTERQSGEIYRLELDENMEPVGDPEVLVEGTGGWHDSLTVDACGNVWYTSWFGWVLGRVGPGGEVTELRTWEFDFYGHGIVFGESPWNELSLFMPHPYIGSVITESHAGVPGRNFQGEVIGGQTL